MFDVVAGTHRIEERQIMNFSKPPDNVVTILYLTKMEAQNMLRRYDGK